MQCSSGAKAAPAHQPMLAAKGPASGQADKRARGVAATRVAACLPRAIHAHAGSTCAMSCVSKVRRPSCSSSIMHATLHISQGYVQDNPSTCGHGTLPRHRQHRALGAPHQAFVRGVTGSIAHCRVARTLLGAPHQDFVPRTTAGHGSTQGSTPCAAP